MPATTFTPIKKHLGEFIKATSDVNNTLLGFSNDYSTVYSAGSGVVKPQLEDSYYWNAANLFTGVNAESFEELTSIRDALKVFNVVLGGAIEVLQIVISLSTDLVKGPTQLILQSIASLIDKLIALFNPSINLSALYIPPMFGKVTEDLKTYSNSTAQEKAYVSSITAKNTLIDSLTRTTAFLPTSLRSNIDSLIANNSPSFGSAYLLSTLRKKVRDKEDSNRPELSANSFWCGFGVFIGSPLPHTVLESWNSFNSLLKPGTTLLLPPPENFPPTPTIQAHKVSELSGRLSSTPDSISLSPVQRSIVCRPLVPTDYSSPTTTFTFTARLIYFSIRSELTSDKAIPLASDLAKDVNTFLHSSGGVANELNVETRNTNTNFMLFSRSVPSTTRVVNLIKKLDTSVVELEALTYSIPVYKAFLAVDVYSVTANQTTLHYPMLSGPMVTKVLPANSGGSFDISYTSSNPLLNPGGGLFPSWYSAGFAINILPNALSEVVNFLDLFKTYIDAFSDSVLDFLTNLLNGLKDFLNMVQDLIAQIDSFIKLLDSLTSISTSIGASVMAFSGEGGTSPFLNMFEEYLSTEETKPTSLSEVLTEYPQRETVDVTLDGLVKVAKESPSSVETVVGNYKDYLSKLKDETTNNYATSSNIVPKRRSGTFGTYSGAKSPMFTDNDTTCGIILVATSRTLDELNNIKKLLDLLFEEEDTPRVEPLSEALAKVGNLSVDLPNLVPQELLLTEEAPIPLFSSNMSLTTNTEKSPFDFCP
jgi:hypothetical protein